MLYSKLLSTIFLPLADKFLGQSYQKELKCWRKIQWMSHEQIYEMQIRNLSSLLNFAIRNIPYYRNEVKLDEKLIELDPINALKVFPILTKQIIKGNLHDLILGGDPKGLTREISSGSSGIQGSVYLDKAAYSRTLAVQTLWWEWAGYQFGTPLIQTGMTLNRGFIKRVKDILLRTSYTQAFRMDMKTVEKNLSKFRSTDDYIFGGYASSLYIYALLARELAFNDIKFKSVISWGDKMFLHYRKLIEEQFHTEVFDNYGCTEGTMIAGECEYHKYHIMSPHVYLEILDEKGNEVNPGNFGAVFVTRLDNFVMPLIRYKLADLVKKTDPNRHCDCGRGFPVLDSIIGRDTDIIRTPDGMNLIVHFFTGIFEHFPTIKQFQVVQKKINSIEIRYIPANDFKLSILEDIRLQIEKHIGKSLQIIFKEVNKIEPTKSGKPQIIISSIPFGVI